MNPDDEYLSSDKNLTGDKKSLDTLSLAGFFYRPSAQISVPS
jgi:hypothetical protein